MDARPSTCALVAVPTKGFSCSAIPMVSSLCVVYSVPVAFNTYTGVSPPPASRPFVLPPSPRLYTVGSWYAGRAAPNLYTSGPQVISSTPRELRLESGLIAASPASPIIGQSFRPPTIYRASPLLSPRRVVQPACVPTSSQFVPIGTGPVVAISPRSAATPGILDDQYKEQVVRQAQTAAQNAYRAGVSVYQSVRDALHGQVNGTS